MATATNPILPDFTRWSWSGVPERQWFLPRLQRASAAFLQLERLSVVAGFRKMAWQNVTTTELVEAAAWAQRHGLIVVPTGTVGTTVGYSNTPVGGTSVVRIVYVHPKDYAEVFPWDGNNHIGQQLGFPPCCRQAFAQTWGKGQVDSTWEQVEDGTAGNASSLLRHVGIRLMSHMPCRINCEASEHIAEQYYKLGCESGYQDEVEFIREMTNWPMMGTRLFGIAEYVTPALKIVARTDWTPTKDTFIRKGIYVKPETTWWTDNGFNDPDAMYQAHRPLLDAIFAWAPNGGRVIDLGCGNGLLLKTAKHRRADIHICGVDVNEEAITRATGILSNLQWVAGRIQNIAWENCKPDLVLINPARLQEMDVKDAQETRDKLVNTKPVLVYCYSDYDSLEKLCMGVGLPVPEMLTKTPHVQVGILR